MTSVRFGVGGGTGTGWRFNPSPVLSLSGDGLSCSSLPGRAGGWGGGVVLVRGAKVGANAGEGGVTVAGGGVWDSGGQVFRWGVPYRSPTEYPTDGTVFEDVVLEDAGLEVVGVLD